MERIARNEKLHPLSCNDVRPNNNMPDLAIARQHEHFEGIAEIIVIELIITDAVKSHGASGVTRKYNADPNGVPPANGCGNPPGATQLLAQLMLARTNFGITHALSNSLYYSLHQRAFSGQL